MRVIIVSLLVVLLGCSGGQSLNPLGRAEDTGGQSAATPSMVFAADASQLPARPRGAPGDFFPTETGTRWRYDIEVGGSDKPLRYGEVSWPLGGHAVTYATRGILYPPERLREEPGRGDPQTYALEMRVKGPATQQGPLRYPLGVELAIDRDDLGVFRGSNQVFWAVSSSDRYMVNLVVTYPPDSPGAPTGSFGAWGQEDGSDVRLFFFGEKPGIQISRAGSPDQLLFEGLDEVVGEEAECLKFLRTVEASEEKDERATPLDRGFSEQTWFARGKGLVRLVQSVDGVQTMTWTLTKFTPGT